MSSLHHSINYSPRGVSVTPRRRSTRQLRFGAHKTPRTSRHNESLSTTTNASSSSSSSSSSSGDFTNQAPLPIHQPQPRPQKNVEVRVCTNKTCRRQGSEAIAKLSSDLNLPGVTTKKCGCLGACGSGPNVAFLFVEESLGKAKKKDKGGGGVVASHVSTPARFLSALETATGVSVPRELLRATALRLRGNELARAGDLKGAEEAYSMALEGGGVGVGVDSDNDSDGEGGQHAPAPAGARHLLLSNRSGVRLALGDARGALADAEAAAAEAPEGWGTALVRLSEARAALGDVEGAREALSLAREADRAVDEALRRRR